MTPLVGNVPVALTAAALPEPLAPSSASDLDRLRSLIQSTASQTANPAGNVAAPDLAVPPGASRSLGDSILQGMLAFGEKYQNSMKMIDTRVKDVVGEKGDGLNNFSDLISLQIDVSKWSMSVTGVDNAAKAGTNTIKELSKGG
ncbi:MAG: hypothetical protein RIQ93_2082 [Verrucomicrobiota bacterium]|jgi:hypothetical protein